MRVRVVPYKRGSESAILLARALGELTGETVFSGRPMADKVIAGRRAIRLRSGRVRPGRPDVTVRYTNVLWGADVTASNPIQPVSAMRVAKNKLLTFNKLKEGNVNIPAYTTSKAEAQRWINDGETVFARTHLSAYGGIGIVICNNTDHTTPLPTAPLYVKYVKKKHEFRVHVVNGAAIDVQQKRRRTGDEHDSMIRNHDNGWVFCREDIVEPTGLREIAVKAVNCLGLTFGAVDIIYNEHYRALYVLEINTAPGLSETTAENYAEALLPLIRR